MIVTIGAPRCPWTQPYPGGAIASLRKLSKFTKWCAGLRGSPALIGLPYASPASRIGLEA